MLESSTDVAIDDWVDFTFTVRNEGEDPIELQFSDAQQVDFAVYDGDEEIWRYSDGKMFAQVLTAETLDPDDALSFDSVWENPPDGTFEVVGTLEAKNADCSDRVEFTT